MASELDFHKYLIAIKSGCLSEEYLKANGGELPSVYYESTLPFSFKRPCGLFHAMLEKVQTFRVRGMIWYQGESEAFGECADIYKSAMYSLVAQLKAAAGNEDYQFHYVQIAPWDDSNIRQWEDICNAQREYFIENPLQGMITIGDCSGGQDIHPPKKRPVGERLALAAFNNTYAIPTEFTGPCAVAAVYDGEKISIAFSHADGLHAKDDIGCFEVVTAQGKKQVSAQIHGNYVYLDYKGEVPLAVQYGWCSYPHIGLFNASGLPASIFKILL